jgi:hypothetical protein
VASGFGRKACPRVKEWSDMMAARAIEDSSRQLALNERWMAAARRAVEARERREAALCAGCREREARYGFRTHEHDPTSERPRTLCFECFRVELGRRHAVAARLARGWNARQVTLPLEHTLDTLNRRRRRAQIAARHVLAE